MKKILYTIILLVVLAGCQKQTNPGTTKESKAETENSKTEHIEPVKEPVQEKEEKTEPKIFSLNTGEEISYTNPEVLIFDDKGSSYELETSEMAKEDLIKLLSKLDSAELKDQYKSIYDEETIIIKLNDKDYIELIESVPNRNGLYQYNYFKDDQLEEILLSKEDIKKQIFEALVDDKILELDKVLKENGPGLIPVNIVNLVDRFYEDGKLIVLANVHNENFSFENGIFNSQTGYSVPLEIRYKIDDDTYVFEEKIEAKDGSAFLPSIEEMARNNRDIVDKLLGSQGVKNSIYDQQMGKLAEKAEALGLRDFRHKLEEIPGYEENSVYIENGPNQIENTVEVGNKDDYQAAKARLGKENWTYIEGVVFHKDTGIVVKGIIDHFE